MYIFNQVINFNETPGILGGTDTEASPADNYPIGTILFNNTNQSIRRNEGTPGNQNWVTYGGSGGALNLQDVLDNGNQANYQSINLITDDNQGESILDYSSLFFFTDNTRQYYGLLNNSTLRFEQDIKRYLFDTKGISYYDKINDIQYIIGFNLGEQIISTQIDGVDQGFFISPIDNKYYGFGYNFDYTNFAGNGLVIDSTHDFAIVSIGAVGGIGQNTYITVDDFNQHIYTGSSIGGVGFYFDINNKNYIFGDWDSNNNGTRITINDSTQEIYLQSAAGYTDFVGSNVISASAGGNSGNHLVIKANGVLYKIALLNI